MADQPIPDDAKQLLRRRLLARRRRVESGVRAVEADALAAALIPVILESTTPGDTVCGYLPVGSEPGSVRLLDALVDQGRRVLLPVTDTDPDGQPRALRWGVYRAGELTGARYGLLEPAGPSLDPSVIAESRVIVVPALAVQSDGARLGRGAGFYDRSLPLADPSALLIAVVRDDEVLDDVPTGAHDVTMTHIATPAGGVRPCR